MVISARVLSSLAGIFACVVSVAIYHYKKRKTVVDEVMIFCKLQYNGYHYFDKFIACVEAAQESVNVCMPSIHSPAIQKRLVSLLKDKSIKISIIIDKSGYNESTHFFIKELISAGAVIKNKTELKGFVMDHKFCLIDDKLLMIGTFDWGNDLSSDLWNYVYITNRVLLVSPIKNIFYNIWKNYSTDFELMEESTFNSSSTCDETFETSSVTASLD